MINIIPRAARLMKVPIDDEGAESLARRARGTPRIGLRLLKRVRDYAQVRADGNITTDVATEALDMMGIDHLGLDDIDRRVLSAPLREVYGGPGMFLTDVAAVTVGVRDERMRGV